MADETYDPKHDVAVVPNAGNFMTNATYDRLKWIAQYILPALGALYFGLAQIWDLPVADKIVGSLAVLNVFLGVLLGYSTKKYEANTPEAFGTLRVNTSDPDKDVYSLEFPGRVDTIPDMDKITFKVVSQ